MSSGDGFRRITFRNCSEAFEGHPSNPTANTWRCMGTSNPEYESYKTYLGGLGGLLSTVIAWVISTLNLQGQAQNRMRDLCRELWFFDSRFLREKD